MALLESVLAARDPDASESRTAFCPSSEVSPDVSRSIDHLSRSDACDATNGQVGVHSNRLGRSLRSGDSGCFACLLSSRRASLGGVFPTDTGHTHSRTRTTA